MRITMTNALTTIATAKTKKTNIFILDKELWNWAQYRSKQLENESVSEYLFDLIREDKKKSKP
jgi:hypothetical protein